MGIYEQLKSLIAPVSRPSAEHDSQVSFLEFFELERTT